MKFVPSHDRAVIEQLPSRFRAHLINSLSGFKSANLIGSRCADGVDNLAIVSSVVHLGANPPLLGMIFRPTTVERHSLENLRASGVFTLNQVTADMLPAAHQTSAKYPRNVSEFTATGLTPCEVQGFAAPAVAESRVRLGLRYLRTVPITENQTEMVIAAIDWIDVPKDAIATDGYVNIERLETVAVSGLDGYHRTQQLARYSYAEPDKAVTILSAKTDESCKD